VLLARLKDQEQSWRQRGTFSVSSSSSSHQITFTRRGKLEVHRYWSKGSFPYLSFGLKNRQELLLVVRRKQRGALIPLRLSWLERYFHFKLRSQLVPFILQNLKTNSFHEPQKTFSFQSISKFNFILPLTRSLYNKLTAYFILSLSLNVEEETEGKTIIEVQEIHSNRYPRSNIYIHTLV